MAVDVLIEEEREPDYDSKHFYPVKLGEYFMQPITIAA